MLQVLACWTRKGVVSLGCANRPGRCPGLMNGCPVGAEDLKPVKPGLSALKGRQFVSPGQRPGLRHGMNEGRTARVQQ